MATRTRVARTGNRREAEIALHSTVRHYFLCTFPHTSSRARLCLRNHMAGGASGCVTWGVRDRFLLYAQKRRLQKKCVIPRDVPENDVMLSRD